MDIDIPPYKGRETATERDYHPRLYKNTYSFPWSTKNPDSWVSSVEFWRSLNSEIIWIFFPLQRSFLSYELTVFQKYKGSAGNSDCGSPTGAFSMDDYKKANNTTETLLLSQDSHQNDKLAEYKRDKSSNFNSYRWVSGNSWETQVCCISSTFRIHLCHICFSYHREIKIVPCPFITNTSSTWTELYSCYYYHF